MKEIGILYSTPMVLAKLAGRKTVTRRPVTVDDLIAHPQRFRYIGNSEEMEVPKPAIKYDDRVWYQWELVNNNGPSWVERCRWNKGDILYGRELHYAFGIWIEKEGEYTQTGKPKLQFIPTSEEIKFIDNPLVSIASLKIKHDGPAWYKRSSLFLPKEKSRIYERVISVRPERLGDITEEDAVREGVEYFDDHGSRWFKDYTADASGYGHPDVDFPTTSSAVKSFISLWQSIHGPESWNPDLWVWRIETEILSTTGRPANI